MAELDLLSELDVDVWKSLVYDGGIVDGVLEYISTTPGIHKMVDVSELHMSRAFDVLDKEEVGALTKEQFAEGINRCLVAFGGKQVHPNHEGVYALWKAASASSEGAGKKGVTPDAFAKVRSCAMTLHSCP